MIWTLMLYLLIVSTCIALAAAFFERALLHIHAASRAVWIVSMWAAALCIFWTPALRTTSGQHAITTVQNPVTIEASKPSLLTRATHQLAQIDQAIDRTMVVDASRTSSNRFDFLLLLLWIAASIATLVLYCAAALRLRRIGLAAETTKVDGLTVLMTSSTGPLTFGVIHPQIFLPGWLSEFDSDARRIVLVHEEEHLRRADPATLMFGAAMHIVMPWNPAMWYMLARLRQAVELDCDRRVLRALPDRRAYAELLLSIAGRTRHRLFPVAGFVVSHSALERRFLQMKNQSTRFKVPLVVTLVAAGVLIAAVPLTIPRPQMQSAVPSQATNVAKLSHDRATGRVHLVSKSGYATYRIYSERGAFAKFGEEPRVRIDTLSGIIGDVLTGPAVILDVDVTDGPVHVLGADSADIHLDAAMSGTSPVGWVSANGTNLIIESNGIGFGGTHRQNGSRR